MGSDFYIAYILPHAAIIIKICRAYPVLFLSIAIQFRFSELGQKIINGLVNKFPDTTMVLSTPLYMLVAVCIITGLFYYFSGPLYRLDFNSLYGRMFKKLEELISDMEELRR